MQRFLKPRMPRRGMLAIVAVACTALTGPAAVADDFHHGHHGVFHPGLGIGWPYHQAVDALSAQMHAQAELLRARGDAAVHFAYAHQLHSLAVNQDLVNWNTYWRTLWSLRTQRQLANMVQHYNEQLLRERRIDDLKWQNKRFVDRVESHPETLEGRIIDGSALNALLARLAVVMPETPDSLYETFPAESVDSMIVDHELLRFVKLKNGVLTVPALANMMEHIDYWPTPLDRTSFAELRQQYERARAKAVQESVRTGQVRDETLAEMEAPLRTMREMLRNDEQVQQWWREAPTYNSGKRRRARHHLTKLIREIKVLEETQSMFALQLAFGYDPDDMGDNIVHFIAHLNRNGLEFAPASPRAREAYMRMFRMMRELYLYVRDQDSSTKPNSPIDRAMHLSAAP